MSEAATQLLATFETLPASEQHSPLMELLRRSGASSDAAVGDELLVLLGEGLFQALDAEEANGSDAQSR